jgi:hypothetical protein
MAHHQASDKTPTTKELKKEIESAKSNAATFNPLKELGETRSKIAKQFVFWYFILIGGSFIFTLIYNLLIFWLFPKFMPEQIIAPKDILLTAAGIVGSPLGFIVGYYFKDIQK